MYKLYNSNFSKFIDAFGLDSIFFWKKNKYQEFWALRDIELTVKKGMRLGIIGKNGAGKSTLLKIIAGNLKPTSGSIKINGKIQALMELGTGFHPEFTGRENIRVALSYLACSLREIKEKEQEIIHFAEIDDFIDQPLKTYSAGMYARLAFSTATAIEPEILIIDEVLGAGDAYFAGKCIERMKKLTEDNNSTVLFVSHDLGSVQRFCEHVIWIDKGKIRESGDPLSVIKKYATVVRKEESIRLIARDMKVLKNQAASINSLDDLYTNILFHFVPQDRKKIKGKKVNIYQIGLCQNDSLISQIEVGGPMDNSPEQMSYIIDTRGFMDWSNPQKDRLGYYREILGLNSKFGHAPFQFAVPKANIGNRQPLTIKVLSAVDYEGIILELFDGSKYYRLGELSIGEGNVSEFQIPNEIINKSTDDAIDVKKEEENKFLFNDKELFPQNIEVDEFSEYGSKEAWIEAVVLYNHEGEDTRVFEIFKPMKVSFYYKSTIELINPVFVFCIYLLDGRCASQWVADSSKFGTSRLPKKGVFHFYIDQLSLGKGQYIASAAIFKQLSLHGNETESYHVLDHCIHFEVTQIEDGIDRGIAIQNFRTGITR